jgi:hypothetical protein
MNRRQFLKATIVTTLVATSGVGYLVLTGAKSPFALTIEGSLEQLASLDEKQLSSTGEWDIAQIFNHCAQSVEFSITGYPEHKSAIFKNTVGSLAFSLFTAKGSMSHGLSEAIPGASVITPAQPIKSALARLHQSLVDFNAYTGKLAPHFAYGQLSKAQYSRAHAMHLNNHLQQVIIKAV